MEEILDADGINRWVFFPLDFVKGADNDPLLDISKSFPFELIDNRRQESVNLSRLMAPFPATAHQMGHAKAEATRQRYLAQGKDKPYEYKGFLETIAGNIRSITVATITLAVYHDPDLELPNPAHVTIEMQGAEGIENAKSARNLIKDKLARAFGGEIIAPA